MGFFDRVFGKKKNELPPEDNSIELKINEAIAKTESDIRNTQMQQKQIADLAADVIITTFAAFYPNSNLSFYRDKYKKEAYANYEKVKVDWGNKIDTNQLAECERLVLGYKNQLQLLDSRMELLNKMSKEQIQMKQQYAMTKNRSNTIVSNQNNVLNLNNEAPLLVASEVDLNAHNTLKEEVELKQEYYKQLEELNAEIKGTNVNNTLAYKDEIDKMLDKTKNP